jgi:hypothetical protein
MDAARKDPTGAEEKLDEVASAIRQSYGYELRAPLAGRCSHATAPVGGHARIDLVLPVRAALRGLPNPCDAGSTTAVHRERAMKYADQLPTPVPEDRYSAAHASQRRGHGWMMMLCCIPMVAVVVALVVTGIATVGLVFTAVLCVGMMAMMMRGMNHSGRGK